MYSIHKKLSNLFTLSSPLIIWYNKKGKTIPKIKNEDNTLIYLINKNTDPSLNHAIEEYYMKDTKEDVFSIWQNLPTVLLGKNQDAYQELDLDYIEKNNIKIVRRLSGGGTVYCDLGNMQYTLITADDKNSGPGSFQKFAKPVVDFLKSQGLQAEFTGRNDILIDGKKISGNAQYRHKNRIIHHGTLLFKVDMEALSGAIKSRPIKLRTKGVKSVSSRITTISSYLKDLTVEEFIEMLQTYIINYYKIEKIAEVNQEIIEKSNKYLKKFQDPEWNLGRDYKNYCLKSEKYPFGLVEYKAIIDKKTIKFLNILGDYFGEKDKDQLCQILIGAKIEEDSLKSLLSGVEIGDYINGMDKNILIKDLLDLGKNEKCPLKEPI